MKTTLLFVALLLLLLGSTTAQDANRLSVLQSSQCTGDLIFAAGVNRCVPCTNHSTNVDGVCVCNKGHAYHRDPVTYTATCVDCLAIGRVPSLIPDPPGDEYQCVRCGGAEDIYPSINFTDTNLTIVGADNITTATFSYVAGRCTCPAKEWAVTETLGTRLPVQVCVKCESGTVEKNNPNKCLECEYPWRVDVDRQECICTGGFSPLGDGTCVATPQVEQINNAADGPTAVTLKNLDNSGKDGESVASAIIDRYLTAASLGCSVGNQTACNLLANMCVIMHYAADSAPCAMYRNLHSRENCVGFACEIPKTLPWLYYLRSSPTILQDEDIKIRVQLASRMRFILSEFAWNGEWLGNTLVTTQLHLCDFSSSDAMEFFAVGSDRALSCEVNLRWFLGSKKTSFYELYLEDGDQLRDVPVLVDYSNVDINPTHVHDDVLFREGATSLQPQENAFVRRFYIYDNVGGVGVGDINTAQPSYITVARRVKLLISLQPTSLSRIFTPLMIIQYATFKTGGILQQTSFNLNELPFVRTNTSSGPYTLQSATSVKFTMDTRDLENSLMITLIVFCCVCCLTAIIRTNGWMRRQQNMMLEMGALIRFFLYYCQHLSNLFLLTVVITCGYMYLFYKHQSSVEYAMPVNNRYIWGMLYTAVVAKGLVVIARIHEQCNADVFVIDWERTKGALLRENKDVPISMWRSTFIANEFNELQTLRAWNPLMTMIIVMLFLEGLGYVNLAATVPWADTSSAVTAPPHPFLRIAVAAFFWGIVFLVIYFFQWYIYYKFIEVHPLQAFVDLCSVSNISLMILLEPQWGFYIHGESIHAHSDISIEEFQDNLKSEAQGNLPARGLGGQDLCQTFEVFVSTVLRNKLFLCYSELYQEYMKAMRGEAGPVDATHHRRCFEFLSGGSGQTRVFTNATLAIKNRITAAFKQSVRDAEKQLWAKDKRHELFDYPPNVMFMNGQPSMDGQSVIPSDVFFFDEPVNYGRSLLYAIDHDMFLLYFLLFLCVDTSLFNTYWAMIIVYILDLLLVTYRAKEGQANIGSKTLFDDRFFL